MGANNDANAEHWQRVYTTKPTSQVSWFQPAAALSLDLIAARSLSPTAPIIDVGAGASTLVDGLLARGHSDITLLDITKAALEAVRNRIGERIDVHYVVADVSQWAPTKAYALWHDRAVFHFLVDEPLRAAYRHALTTALPVGAHAIIATFAPDGPDRCSGLPVRRYSTDALAKELGHAFRTVDSRREVHATPSGTEQSFAYTVLERV